MYWIKGQEVEQTGFHVICRSNLFGDFTRVTALMDNVQFVQNVTRIHHQFCALLDQSVRSSTHWAEDVARYGKYLTPLLRSNRSRDNRSALFRCFGDHNTQRHAADYPVAAWEVPAFRWRAERKFADQRSPFNNLRC